MRDELKKRLEISADKLAEINAVLLDPDSQVIGDLLDVVAKYGTPEEINAKAAEAGKLENLLASVKTTESRILPGLALAGRTARQRSIHQRGGLPQEDPRRESRRDHLQG